MPGLLPNHAQVRSGYFDEIRTESEAEVTSTVVASKRLMSSAEVPAASIRAWISIWGRSQVSTWIDPLCVSRLTEPVADRGNVLSMFLVSAPYTAAQAQDSTSIVIMANRTGASPVENTWFQGQGFHRLCIRTDLSPQVARRSGPS